MANELQATKLNAYAVLVSEPGDGQSLICTKLNAYAIVDIAGVGIPGTPLVVPAGQDGWANWFDDETISDG